MYIDYYQGVKLMLESTSLTIDELEEAMISNANRLQLLTNELTNESIKESVERNGKTMIIGSHDNLKIKSDLSGSDIYVGDAVDGYIDGMNIVLSYFQHYDRVHNDNELKEPETINQFMRVSIMTNTLAAFKNWAVVYFRVRL